MRALQIDTRQQAGKHDHKHDRWASEGVPIVVSKLAFGDYAYTPRASVDTKQHIYELAMDLTADHARFRRECIAARDAGCQLVVLVENTAGVSSNSELAAWEEPLTHFNMRKRKSKNPKTQRWQGERLAKACKTMNEKYGVIFDFCAPDEAADRIRRILDYYEEVST